MSTIFKEIRNSAITLLAREERAALAHDLISSLDERDDSSGKKAWGMEIKRRVDEIKSGKIIGKPAENVLAEIRARYS